MERLIVGPLKTTHISTLIIIDALDECLDEEPASAILSVLSRYADKIPHVKFFVTGRPEPRIRSGFRLETLQPITEVLNIDDVQRSFIDDDVELFFRAYLAEIAKNQSHWDPARDWPLSSDVDILCAKAAGLFIYASTDTRQIHRIPRSLPLRETQSRCLPSTRHQSRGEVWY